jgi:RHS repeat-associated protein
VGTHTYQWDAEGRLKSVDSGSTLGITMDGLGQGVEYAGTGFKYEELRDAYGQWIGRYDGLNGAWLVPGVVHAVGRKLVMYPTSGTWFLHPNNLGSTGINTDQAGTLAGDVLYYPFGQFWQTLGMHEFHFAGFDFRYTRSWDPAIFRTYAFNQGRWLSPDPLGGDITNPQSLNRYSYVLNNPATLTDPLGLQGNDCTFANGCRQPRFSDAVHMEVGCGPGYGPCFYVDGVLVSQRVGYGTLSAGNGPLSALGLSTAAAAQQAQGSQAYGVLVNEGTGTDVGVYVGDDPWWYNSPTLADKQFTLISAGTNFGGPDFYQGTFNFGTWVGLSLTYSVDRYGRMYFGIGPQAGKSAVTKGYSWSVAAGMMRGHSNYAPSATELHNFLTGWGCSAGGGAFLGYFFGWSGGGQANEAALTTPQAGIGCAYSWRIP